MVAVFRNKDKVVESPLVRHSRRRAEPGQAQRRQRSLFGTFLKMTLKILVFSPRAVTR